MTNATNLWLTETAQQRRDQHLVRSLRTRQLGDPILDLASNDYLDLARDPRVVEAAIRATRDWGAGSTGSRLVTGTTSLHVELDQALASFVGSPDALTFSSGYLANLGAIASLANRDTTIISDRLNHASLIDAIRLSRAQTVIVDHRDVSAVEAALNNRSTQRAIVVTDGVFSVDGDLAPLQDLHRACERHDALLIVDEAHALGVVGPRGQGSCQQAGIAASDRVVMTLTLSKSLGSQGGAVAGSSNVIKHLIDTARSFIFDTGLAPSNVAAALESLAIIVAEPQRVAAVKSNAQHLRQLGIERGYISSPSDGAVISLQVSDAADAVAAAQACLDHGVKVGCFRPPSVPDGISRLRLTSRATLTQADLSKVGDALDSARTLEEVR